MDERVDVEAVQARLEIRRKIELQDKYWFIDPEFRAFSMAFIRADLPAALDEITCLRAELAELRAAFEALAGGDLPEVGQ